MNLNINNYLLFITKHYNIYYEKYAYNRHGH